MLEPTVVVPAPPGALVSKVQPALGAASGVLTQPDAAIAAPRAEDVSCEALRVQAYQDRPANATRLETSRERNVLLAVRRLVDEHLEAAVGGRQPCSCNASDRRHGCPI